MSHREHTAQARLLAAVLSAGFFVDSQALADMRRLIVTQDAPALTDVDIGASGKSHGDMLAFEAAIRSEAASAGTLRGILFTVALPGAGRSHEGRIGQLYFDFGNGDSLVVSGGTTYSGQNREMIVDAPQVRAVIGGTGEFIGARGQVKTTRKADGIYDHSFELVK